MDRLDARAIALSGIEVRVLERCSSTNALLRAEARADVLLAAEEQTAGRGRRGRRWHCAPGHGVTFSLAKLVRRPARELAGLSLVVGVGAAAGLRALGADRVALKWPNDLVLDGSKLGGILVETASHAGSTLAVVGIGINCRRDPALAQRVRRPVAFLDQQIEVDRNSVIRVIARSVLEALNAFDAQGLQALRAQWESMHAHAGERVRLRLADGRTLSGIARGLEHDGALRIQTAKGMRSVRSAEVMRTRPA